MTDETTPVKLVTRPVKYKGTHPYIYRSGEEAEIIGVRMVISKSGAARPCWMLLYPDGMIDYTAVGEVLHSTYELV